jgi:predicted secreted protein
MPYFLFVLLFLLQIVNGCRQMPAGKSFSAEMREEVPVKILIEKCADKTEVNLNDTIVLRFTEVSGRGYAWSLGTPDSPSFLVKPSGVKRYILEDKDGAEEKVEFYFIAISRGTTSLKFRYFRPWEKTRPAADSCITQITIK